VTWRSHLTPTGWEVAFGNRGRDKTWARFQPDRHGRAKILSTSLVAPATIDQVEKACAVARHAMPPRTDGGIFYGTKSSLIRGQFCDLVAAALNDEAGS
jgi:hypothetical protein